VFRYPCPTPINTSITYYTDMPEKKKLNGVIDWVTKNYITIGGRQYSMIDKVESYLYDREKNQYRFHKGDIIEAELTDNDVISFIKKVPASSGDSTTTAPGPKPKDYYPTKSEEKMIIEEDKMRGMAWGNSVSAAIEIVKFNAEPDTDFEIAKRVIITANQIYEAGRYKMRTGKLPDGVYDQ